MNKLEELIRKLKEILQIDRPDLDFGIYRVINARAGEISKFLEDDLPAMVRKELAREGGAALEKLKDELKEKEEQYRADGLDPDSVPKVQELRKQIAAASQGNVDYENEVYSHLLKFFSRYYDKGDFISKRRYKGDTYAIPYSGEEVKLVWANMDQYYIKSGENFTDYAFTLDDGRKVHFKLVAADTAKDNRKDTDKTRCFVLAEARTVTRQDADGKEYDETITPIESLENALVIRFQYKPMPKGAKQADLVNDTVTTVLKDESVLKDWTDLARRVPTEKNPERTLLEKQLTDYTAKNSADYFIHKNLGEFLNRELDFYIKTEVMDLDDIQHVDTFQSIERNLKMIQCLRAIAQKLITFMAQLEDFQKKLWLKKKFVVETNYCITLDRVPEDLYSEIATNEAQHDEWVKLFAIDEIEADTTGNPGYKKPLTVEFLKANDKLIIDTRFFSDEFKASMLDLIDNFDEQCNGLLVDSENFQALHFLQNRLNGVVDGIYIDPPYNTSASEIIYKNSYKHSSWLSFVGNRTACAKQLLSLNGCLCVTIDDFEFRGLLYLLEEQFSEDNITGVVAIKNNPSGRATPKGLSISHEYAVFAVNSTDTPIVRLSHSDQQAARYKERDVKGQFEWVNFRKHGGANANRHARPRLFYPILASEDQIRIPSMKWNPETNEWDLLAQPSPQEKVIYPVDSSGSEKTWKWGHEKALANPGEFRVGIDRDNKRAIYRKARLNEEGTLPRTIWDDKSYSSTSYGTNLLADIMGEKERFSFPKSVFAVADCIRVLNIGPSGSVVDFFAGSGTTGHAVSYLNREDGGCRKFTLVEMGMHFDSVMLPRVLKAIYASDWKQGKPQDHATGLSQCIKYLRLESYEDALNNLKLESAPQGADLFTSLPPQVKEEYLLRYMLKEESQSSLLSTDAFQKPFDYHMQIATDSSGASALRKVDLVETFNYLIGLKVKHTVSRIEKGYVYVEGETLAGEHTLVIWRDCEKVGYEDLTQLCKHLDINPRDFEYDVLYINGDHNIPQTVTTDESEGGITLSLKLRQTEHEFLKRMFDVEDV